MDDDLVVTPDGLARLSADLDRLKSEGRRAVAERLQDAAASGANRLEDADFLDARDEQALLERRIAHLEERLQAATLVTPQPGNGRVDVGERVHLRDLATGEQLELELVGPLEADPGEGRVSIVSPLGRSILGRRLGEIASVEAPGGRRWYEVVAVEAPARKA
jgi:transcription elongation factor GreA